MAIETSKKGMDSSPLRRGRRRAEAHYLLLDSELQTLLKKALVCARRLCEIAGVIVGNREFLSLVEIRNVSRLYGSFQLHRGDWRKMERACNALGMEIVGTFHSHIASDPIPSRGDIRGAINGHLMLILDATGRKSALWQVRRGKAIAQEFEVWPASG
jgi:proteasome lid subunit RPN8/RPN11